MHGSKEDAFLLRPRQNNTPTGFPVGGLSELWVALEAAAVVVAAASWNVSFVIFVDILVKLFCTVMSAADTVTANDISVDHSPYMGYIVSSSMFQEITKTADVTDAWLIRGGWRTASTPQVCSNRAMNRIGKQTQTSQVNSCLHHKLSTSSSSSL